MGINISPVERAISAGLDYILAQQSPDGNWTEWELPPGRSSTWPTAYIGYKLRVLPERLNMKATSRLRLAAQWLLVNQDANGGWGYNETVATDADTTAFAILSLASAGLQAPPVAYRSLARHQNPDGGFCTYLPEAGFGSWTMSHPDVTPVALLALLTQAKPDHASLERGIEYVLRNRNPDGLWNSFWWDGCLYSTEANLGFMQAANLEIERTSWLSPIQAANAFESALLISSLLHVDAAGFYSRICDLADQLIAQQRPDGSWETAPILQITRRDCPEPWATSNPGTLFSDPHRLFTTTTVLYALSRTIIASH